MASRDLISQLEDSLIAFIPPRVKSLRILEPVYCLRVWYYGTDIDGNRTPSLTLKTEALRKEVIVEKGKKAPHYLWCADEYEVGDGVFRDTVEDKTISRLCREWFLQLPERPLPDDNDLIPLRQTIQRVATVLNRLDWPQYTSVTDDFVVFPADGSHSFGGDYEEMVASVPQEKLDLLRSRSLLGSEKWWILDQDSTG
jgi:hypothetical protein